MYLFENPVLQRELLVNLRMRRAFVLLFLYVTLLGAVVYAAWPQTKKIDMTNPAAAKTLVNLFFLGQYLLASLMAPSFASGAISGEKERKTYEMLLASPLKPAAIVLGKLFASLSHLAVLIFSSLPIVMLCLPLGGVSFYEVLVAYLALILSVLTYGMISLACSSYFTRTAAALVVSYLLILPLAMLGLAFWVTFEGAGELRLLVAVTVLPVVCLVICGLLFVMTSRRLLHPPDVGSEGKEVVDEKSELRSAVGLVIQRDKFPDRLFAPAKRNDLLPDNKNPVVDKEMRSELFSQGTLMLRVVIQVSMFLAIPLMAICLYVWPQYSPFYISYVVLFNMLVGPVFSAGTVTSERERQTLDLLLVTTLSPWQILWGKLISGLRVSTVLTSFLLWPLLLAWIMVATFWTNWLTVFGFLSIIAVSCLTTASIALFCSVMFQKTTVSMMTSYLVIMVMFTSPIAVAQFAESFLGIEIRPRAQVVSSMSADGTDNVLASANSTMATSVEAVPVLPDGTETRGESAETGNDGQQSVAQQFRRGGRPTITEAQQRTAQVIRWMGVASPFAAARSLPLQLDDPNMRPAADLPVYFGFLGFYAIVNAGLLVCMIWLFHARWRVSQ